MVTPLRSTITGSFRDLKGTLTLDQKKPENSLVKVTVAATSIDTGFPARDDVLRSKPFFDIADFPTLEFTSTRVLTTGKDIVEVGDGNNTITGGSGTVLGGGR